jgi:hypothetical protein
MPPLFDDASPPVKYGRRLTAVPLIVPGARIPGTLTPTFGWVSAMHQRAPEGWVRRRLTVSNDCSVDDESQQGHLVCSRVVLQQSRGVVVANRRVGGTLGQS